jgi:hypothetical protein
MSILFKKGGILLKIDPVNITDKKMTIAIEQAIKCLKNIPSRECTEKANRKIDEALSYCYILKENLQGDDINERKVTNR